MLIVFIIQISPDFICYTHVPVLLIHMFVFNYSRLSLVALFICILKNNNSVFNIDRYLLCLDVMQLNTCNYNDSFVKVPRAG